ncbi:MAG: RnfABCDGE type electron transport complex subunit D [Bacilli bacterium]|jgi:electron transport complex protein RnfD|nr:RnfABCDGE type electron transport complex subunit D [Bacilli bacterium]
MTEQKRFSLTKEPYIRKADNKNYGTSVMMRDFVIALLPLILFAWYKNGLAPYLNGDCGFLEMLYPLIFVLVGGLTTYFLEGFYYVVFLKEKNIQDKLHQSFALIPGILLAMVLPLHTPLWILFIGAIFASIIAKLLAGGFGYNIFNPALIGYLFIVTAFYGVITNNGGYFNPSELSLTTGATPLTFFRGNHELFVEGGKTLSEVISTYGSLGNFFIGTIPGAMAETSSLLCLVGLAYLLIRKVINWRIPVIYLGTVFVLTYLIGAFNGYALDLRFPLFNMFSGGLLFGAIFMATEPVTSPRTPNGKIVFALFLGVLTVMLRYISNMSEGVASSILFMNMFAPIIDNIFAKVRVSDNKKKMVVSYVVTGIMVFAIFGFTLLQMGV